MINNKYALILYTVLFPLSVIGVAVMASYERQEAIKTLEAVTEENSLWRSMVDQIPGGVFRVSAPDGVIVYANEGAQKIVGYDSEELVGHSLIDFDIAPKLDMHKRFLRDMEFHRSNVGHWIQREGLVGHKDDAPRLRRVAIRPYFDREGLSKWLIFVSPLIRDDP